MFQEFQTLNEWDRRISFMKGERAIADILLYIEKENSHKTVSLRETHHHILNKFQRMISASFLIFIFLPRNLCIFDYTTPNICLRDK